MSFVIPRKQESVDITLGRSCSYSTLGRLVAMLKAASPKHLLREPGTCQGTETRRKRNGIRTQFQSLINNVSSPSRSVSLCYLLARH
jgi:hypothetical protein